MPAPRHVAAVLSAATLAAGLTACGGGDDGSKADYQSALNGFCSSIVESSKKLQADATSVSSSAKTPQAALKRVSTVLETFATTIDGALGKLRSADVPSEYKDFNEQTVKGTDRVIAQLRSAAKSAKAGDTQAIQSLSTTLNEIKVPQPPKDLAEKVPACKVTQ